MSNCPSKSPGAAATATGVTRDFRLHNDREFNGTGVGNQLRETINRLKANTEQLAVTLLGPPTIRTRNELRWGTKGSLVVNIAGDRCGRWHSFEQGNGGDALDLIAFALNCDLRSALRWAQEFVGGGEVAHQHVLVKKPVVGDNARARTQRALSMWDEASALAGTPAARYLASRGIDLDHWPDDLRFHARCPFGEERLPCMVGLVRNIKSNEPQAINRTAIRPDGSGKFFDRESGRDNKKALGPVSGGAIKLTPDDAVTLGLGIAEGIETCLSVMRIGWPVWCLMSTGGIARFPVLSGIEFLTIWADNDASGAGQNAARACARRYADAGIEAVLRYPEVSGTDWNELLGASA